MLGIFNIESETKVHTGASMYRFGAILPQKDYEGKLHLIHFMSRKTTKHKGSIIIMN